MGRTKSGEHLPMTELKLLRQGYGLSMKDITANCRIDKSLYSIIENGHRPLRLRSYQEIVSAFKALKLPAIATYRLLDIYHRNNPMVPPFDPGSSIETTNPVYSNSLPYSEVRI